MSIEWGKYQDAYKAIHDALISGLMSSPEGKKVTKYDFVYDANGNLSTLKAYQGGELLFTLTFTYDANQNLTEIVRS